MAGPFYVDDGGGKAVTAATKANPCQVTMAGHGFANNDKVVFHNIGGMTELNFTNGSTGYTVTKVDDDNITIGVDSSAYGTYTSGGTGHNGLSWAGAFLSLSALDDVFTFASGEIIYIGHDHVCQYAHTANRTITGPTSGLPTIIISATQGSSPPSYAASSSNQIDTSEGAYGIIFDGSFAIHGVRMLSGANISLNSDDNEVGYYEGCTFALGANGWVAHNTSGGRSVFKNITIDLTADGTTSRTNSVIYTANHGFTFIDGLSFTWPQYRAGAIINQAAYTELTISGADFSGFTNATECEIFAGNSYTNIKLINCKTKSSFVPFMSTTFAVASTSVQMYLCGNGDSPEQIAIADAYGRLISTTAITRSSGASIESTACSWLVDSTTSACSENSQFFTPWIYGVLSSTGSKTFTIYITNDTADFTNAEVWLEVEYLGTANSEQYSLAKSQRATITTTAAANASPCADDTTSTWNGAGPSYTYKQSLAVTATVNETGQYRARVAVGVASIASSRYFYIDPKVTVS